MTEIDLTQAEADALLAMGKQISEDKIWGYPDFGGKITIPLVSMDGRERFFLDVRRGLMNLAKGTYQNRGRQVAILARLDFGGSPHRNPDGEEIGSPHLHLYREGFGDKWACPVSLESFPNLRDRWLTLQDFMQYCNIIKPPIIKRGLLT